MDQNLDELELFSTDIVKNEVVDSEEGQMRLTAGKDGKWLVKQKVVGDPLVKEEVEDGELWGYGGYIPRDENNFDEDPEPKRRRLTSAIQANITQKGLNAEIKEEVDAVQLESDLVGYSLPVAAKEPDGSFNVHDLCSNEAAVKEEGEEIQNAADERKSCPVDGCFEKFPSYQDLVKHMKSHPNPVICGFCKKSFGQQWNLRDHYIMHTGEKNFECHLCEYKAARLYNLKTHLRNHEKERPYPCTFCDKSFANSSALTRHARTHRGETPFPCTSCDKRFKTSGNLIKHNRIHTGEKPFACKNCGFKTAWSSTLKAHQKTFSH